MANRTLTTTQPNLGGVAPDNVAETDITLQQLVLDAQSRILTLSNGNTLQRYSDGGLWNATASANVDENSTLLTRTRQ